MSETTTLPSPQEVVVRPFTEWVTEEVGDRIFGSMARQARQERTGIPRRRLSGGSNALQQANENVPVRVRKSLCIEIKLKEYAPDGFGGRTREVQVTSEEIDVPAGSELCLMARLDSAARNQTVAVLFTPTRQIKLLGSGFCVVRELR